MNQPILGRQIKIESNLRCDFDNHIIPIGKIGYQINTGKARGMYHGKLCYQSALKHYEELQKETGIEEVENE